MLYIKKSLKNQSGVVLVVSLVMLLLLTLIGVTGVQVTSLEEKMAGNAKDYNVAFQVAETTLREAESYINGLNSSSVFNGANGLLGESDANPDYLAVSSWGTGNSTISLITHNDIPAAYQPRYIIKYIKMDATDANAGLNVTGYGESTTGGQTGIFRVTSRSTGITGNSQVILQTHYGKIF